MGELELEPELAHGLVLEAASQGQVPAEGLVQEMIGGRARALDAPREHAASTPGGENALHLMPLAAPAAEWRRAGEAAREGAKKRGRWGTQRRRAGLSSAAFARPGTLPRLGSRLTLDSAREREEKDGTDRKHAKP